MPLGDLAVLEVLSGAGFALGPVALPQRTPGPKPLRLSRSLGHGPAVCPASRPRGCRRPFARGYDNVLGTLQGAAANYRDGEATRIERISEHVTDDLACFVEVEHYRAKVGGRSDASSVSVRVTSAFRRSKGTGNSSTATPIPSPQLVLPNR